MALIEQYQAMIRFGFGRRGDEKLPDDPRAWLSAQLHGPDPARFPPGLPTTAEGLTLLRESRRIKLLAGESIIQPVLHLEMKAQTDEVLTTDAPFRERLVWFWANHFTVSLRNGDIAAIVGAYIREAIRPNVTGSFFAMLLAVMRHPAMLIYLDNISSMGPNSAAGKARHLGLNENLGRECLELHTLSPASGYTQADVTDFARLLTGWTVAMDGASPGFSFRPDWHEPGEKIILGRRFPEGEAGGLLALEFLAGHKATHRHLATKLARHFVADDPPPDAVAAVEAALRDTGGDLGAAAQAVVECREAWVPLTKLRTPSDYVMAILRISEKADEPIASPESSISSLGQPIFGSPSPSGWPDRAVDWSGGEAIMQRVAWAYTMVGRCSKNEPIRTAVDAVGPLLQAATLLALGAAGSRREALALLFGSPELQRR